MLLPIANVLTAEQVAHCRSRLDSADWVDGRLTAGHQSAKAKDNAQLPEDSPVARELGETSIALLVDTTIEEATARRHAAVLKEVVERATTSPVAAEPVDA